MENPLHHFELHPIIPIHIGSLDLSLNKGIFVMWAALAVAFFLFMIAVKSKLSLAPGKLQSILELYLQMIKDIADDNIGEEGDKYLPFIASLFLFIFFCNLAGLVPGSYTITSQLVVTGTFAVSIFIMTLIIGISKHGGHFITILVPPGIPKVMVPFLVPIELLSQLSRPLTLALRLFGNMTAGHILLGVIFGMAMTAPMIVNVLPFGFTVLLYGMEVFVSAIQAYIFTLLTCVYIGDVIKLH
jgi:F-type H+-transporting ATPase subunit a